ncbi:type II and III secretion system protein family protein [Sphingomonas sp. S2-65]|uniref:type II and III secretion system protein family protein n=1 Tax=Sphingomonas sp. S2-65 TaxID=2903960 RepID=UPI001F1A0A3E|nr:type II and III secretion system protein family protein [Sphingomonas sp. S2-65]UYY60263.1 pilus assembly protein N-terminal domain-containing protein [Sphingomonas sp. S2-65]
MRATNPLARALAATAMTALLASAPAEVMAQSRQRARVGQMPSGSQRPTSEVLLSIGEGEMVSLPQNVANVWVSNPVVADVYVTNPRQINLFGKVAGEATIFATSASGAVVYSTNVRVNQNITSLDRMLKIAMPDASIRVTTAGQLAVLTGTVASPDDSQQAERLVTAALNPGVNTSDASASLKMAVINRLKTATPLQVNLQVRFAEVSRSFVKNVGVNIATRDSTSGFKFGLAQGRSPGAFTATDLAKFPKATIPLPGGGYIEGAYDPSTGQFINPNSTTVTNTAQGSEFGTLGLAGKLLGLDVLAALDLGETIGQVTTLATPNLTALSGETANFLAGGEIPIPIVQSLGTVSIEYKQYGVSLAFTPTVLADGRISLRVRPEVSQLSASGAVAFNGISVPALTTRRSETTVEIGSGESMVIGGLLQNIHNNSFTKTPGAADIPILGALFRSNAFQRNETELVIVITPYLVKPVNANQIVLPTDGYQAPNDLQRLIGGQLSGIGGGDRPKPSMAPDSAMPTIGAMAPAPVSPTFQAPARPAPQFVKPAAAPAPSNKKKGGSPAPGFGF